MDDGLDTAAHCDRDTNFGLSNTEPCADTIVPAPILKGGQLGQRFSGLHTRDHFLDIAVDLLLGVLLLQDASVVKVIEQDLVCFHHAISLLEEVSSRINIVFDSILKDPGLEPRLMVLSVCLFVRPLCLTTSTVELFEHALDVRYEFLVRNRSKEGGVCASVSIGVGWRMQPDLDQYAIWIAHEFLPTILVLDDSSECFVNSLEVTANVKLKRV